MGAVYNVGGENDATGLQVAHAILERLGKDERLLHFVNDRPGHDQRYAIDCSKLKAELGWKPSVRFEEGLAKTVDWYMENQEWLDNVTSGDYQKYYELQYEKR